MKNKENVIHFIDGQKTWFRDGKRYKTEYNNGSKVLYLNNKEGAIIKFDNSKI